MYKNLAIIALATILFAGCASVPMASKEDSSKAKAFTLPPGDNAGVYFYRAGSFGGALKKDVWIDGKCVGETAPNVFFYELVKGGQQHKISTELEFSPNDLLLMTESGKNYFVNQYMKWGVLSADQISNLLTKKKVSKNLPN